MIKINNLKYYTTIFALAASISLSSCGNSKVVDYSEDLSIETSISTEINNSSSNNRIDAEVEKKIKELEAEIDELNRKIEEANNKINDDYEKIYNLDDLYLNFCLSSIDINEGEDSEAFKTVSLIDLRDYYGLDYNYNKDNNTLTEFDRKKIIEYVKSKVESEILLFQKSYVPIDDLGFYEYDYIDDYQLHRNITLYSESHFDDADSKRQVRMRNDFKKKFSKLIVNEDGVDCISVFDIALIDGNLSYDKDLNLIFTTLPLVSSDDLERYKAVIMNKFNLNLEDDTLRFDPNIYDDVDNAIYKYVIDNQFEYPYKNGEFSDIDFTSAGLQYIALNYKFLDKETIFYIIGTFSKNEELLNMSKSEIIEYAVSNYSISNHQEDLAASNGYYNAIKKFNENKYVMQEMTSKEPYKFCKELIMMQKLFLSLREYEINGVNDVIYTSFLHNYLTNLSKSYYYNKIKSTYLSFTPSKDDDIMTVAGIFIKYYLVNSEEFNIFEELNELNNSDKILTKMEDNF